jgi:hypothetical protein
MYSGHRTSPTAPSSTELHSNPFRVGQLCVAAVSRPAYRDAACRSVSPTMRSVEGDHRFKFRIASVMLVEMLRAREDLRCKVG